MSSVGAVGSNPALYQAAVRATVQPKPTQSVSTKPVTTSDPDHDGDTDKGGVDVKG